MSEVIKLAKYLGWLVYHTHDSRRSEPGFPDLIMIRNGQLVVAELKSAKGKLTHEQKAWLMEYEQVKDCQTFVWNPDSWHNGEIEEVLGAR